MSTTAGYLNKYQAKKVNDTKSIVSQQSSKKSNASDPHAKQDILNKMQQNDEKHRQLMLENNKRRKEKELKLKKEEEQRLKQQTAALEERKKTKEQAYVNYLRNNTKNILQEFKPSPNPITRQTEYPKQNPKPQLEQKQQTTYNQFEALDLEVSQLAKNKHLNKEFEKEWQESFEVMRKSELLDSLDLSQCKPKKTIQQPKMTEIKEILGMPEENSDEEEDELWKNTFKNGLLQQKIQKKNGASGTLQWAEQEVTRNDDILSRMSAKQNSKSPIHQQTTYNNGRTRTSSQPKQPPDLQQPQTQQPSNTQLPPKQKSKPQLDQQQQQQQQLQNQQQQQQEQAMTYITQPVQYQQQKQAANNKAKDADQQLKLLQQQQQILLQKQEKLSKQLGEQEKLNAPSSGQQEVQRKAPQNIRIKQGQPLRQALKKQSSIEDENNHMQEFLEEDLMNLNNVERQLQQELIQINKENKQKIEDVNEKYGVRNLHTSNQVNRLVFVQNPTPITSQEDQIEASLLKLDIMLQQPPSKDRTLPQSKESSHPNNPQQLGNQTKQQVNQQQRLAQQQINEMQPQQQQQQNIYQLMIEQQMMLQQQLLQAQQQIMLLQQQQQTQQIQGTNQQNETQKSEYPKFPSYVLHQDHQTFSQLQQVDKAGNQVNMKPKNIITANNDAMSIVSSQQNDKYTYDLDFAQPKHSYQQQALKKQAQKVSQVKSQNAIVEEDELAEGKIEVKHDLRNLLFD